MPFKAPNEGKRGERVNYPAEVLKSIQIWPGDRRVLRGIKELAEQIATEGQLQPGVVCADSENNTILLAGRRRLAAVMLANETWEARGWPGPMEYKAEKVLAATAAERDVIMRAENREREGITVTDDGFCATRYKNLGFSHSDIAAALNIKPARVAQLLALACLPESMLNLIDNGTIKEAPARAFIGLSPVLIESYVKRLVKGEKPSALVREVRASKRASGKKATLSMKEACDALEEKGTVFATRFLNFLKGKITLDEALALVSPTYEEHNSEPDDLDADPDSGTRYDPEEANA